MYFAQFSRIFVISASMAIDNGSSLESFSSFRLEQETGTTLATVFRCSFERVPCCKRTTFQSEDILIISEFDHSEEAPLSSRAMALTWYVPALFHL